MSERRLLYVSSLQIARRTLPRESQIRLTSVGRGLASEGGREANVSRVAGSTKIRA